MSDSTQNFPILLKSGSIAMLITLIFIILLCIFCILVKFIAQKFTSSSKSQHPTSQPLILSTADHPSPATEKVNYFNYKSREDLENLNHIVDFTELKRVDKLAVKNRPSGYCLPPTLIESKRCDYQIKINYNTSNDSDGLTKVTALSNDGYQNSTQFSNQAPYNQASAAPTTQKSHHQKYRPASQTHRSYRNSKKSTYEMPLKSLQNLYLDQPNIKIKHYQIDEMPACQKLATKHDLIDVLNEELQRTRLQAMEELEARISFCNQYIISKIENEIEKECDGMGAGGFENYGEIWIENCPVLTKIWFKFHKNWRIKNIERDPIFVLLYRIFHF